MKITTIRCKHCGQRMSYRTLACMGLCTDGETYWYEPQDPYVPDDQKPDCQHELQKVVEKLEGDN